VFRVALSPDDNINVLLLLFPHQLAPTQPHQSAFMRRSTLMYAQTKIPHCTFLLSQTFLLPPPNFFQEASCSHLSLEWMRRRLSTVGGNGGNERKITKQVTQHCVFALCRNMTVHYRARHKKQPPRKNSISQEL